MKLADFVQNCSGVLLRFVEFGISSDHTLNRIVQLGPTALKQSVCQLFTVLIDPGCIPNVYASSPNNPKPRPTTSDEPFLISPHDLCACASAFVHAFVDLSDNRSRVPQDHPQHNTLHNHSETQTPNPVISNARGLSFFFTDPRTTTDALRTASA